MGKNAVLENMKFGLWRYQNLFFIGYKHIYKFGYILNFRINILTYFFYE